MDQEIIQRTRYILRARFRRAQSCPVPLFFATCRQLHGWLSSHPILAGHLHTIRRDAGESTAQATKIAADLAAQPGRLRSYEPGFYTATTLADHAGVCLAMLEAVAAHADSNFTDFLLCNLGEYLTKNPQMEVEEAITTVRDVALDGLFEYLDEHLDARNVVLALIGKYKQRAEWFRAAALRALAVSDANSRGGERGLALDLYEYLLDQGVEFFVEPVSGSGEPDIVLREPQGRYVVLDAKYLRADDSPSDIKRKLASGFHQVARYCDDFQEPAGHLIVFSDSKRRITVDLAEADGWRYLLLGGRSVYYTEIRIAESPSASKLGKAEEVLVSREDLLTQGDAP